MNCEVCQSCLMDLLYEELGEARAREAHAHLADCDSCKESFEKLELTRRLAAELPLAEASARVDAAILAAARAQLGDRKGDGEERRAGGLWQAILRFLGSFAMGPQVAMATVMLLVVAIGLWYVPTRERPPDAAGDTVVSPEDDGQAGPTIQPEAPLAAAEEPGEQLDEQYAESRGQGGAAARPQQEVPARNLEPRPQLARSDDSDTVRAQEEGEAASPGSAALALDQERVGSTAEPTRALPEAHSTVAEQAATPAQAQGRYVQRTPTHAPPAVEPPPPSPSPVPAMAAPSNPTESQAPAAGDRGTYDRGVQRANRGDYRGAIEDLQQVVTNPDATARPLVPSAIYHIARSHRAAGNYVRAAEYYERLLRQYPSYSGNARAMVELAETYRRLGRLSEAERWATRAAQNPATAAAAQRELAQIRVRRSAMRRAPNRAAEPAQPAEAADY